MTVTNNRHNPEPFRFLKSLMLLAMICVCGACQTSNGSKYWQYYVTGQSETAQQPPKTLIQKDSNGDLKHPHTPEITQASYIDAQNTQHTTIESAKLAPMDVPRAPVKVALLLPLSGNHASLGKSMLKSAQIALFDIAHDNFELMPHDTKGSPEGARDAAWTVINQGADLILGPVFASSVQAVKPLASRANINVIAFSTDWVQAGRNVFLMGFMPFDQIERITRYVATNVPGDVAVIAPDTQYGKSVSAAWRSIANRHNINTTKTLIFPTDNSNLAPIMRDFTDYDNRILQARLQQTSGRNASIEDIQNLEGEIADASKIKRKYNINLLNYPPPFDSVLMPVGGESALAISNLLSHYDLPPSTVRRIGTGLLDDPSIMKEQSLGGALFAAPSPTLRKDFENKFKQTYGYEPPRIASLSYDAVALASVLAYRGWAADGRPDFSRYDIMNPNGFYGIDGIFRFRSNGTAERGLAVLEIKDGQTTIVEEAPTTFQTSFEY